MFYCQCMFFKISYLGGFLNFQGTRCCNYGADGKKISDTKGGYDCILIPGAVKAADSAIKSPKICGSKMGLITATGTTNASVCCE